MQAVKISNPSDQIELEYSQFTSTAHKKKFAQFFTPYPIAELMAKWLLGNANLQNVLEPAFGLGIFSRALLTFNNSLCIKGFEIDDNIFQRAQELFADKSNVSLFLQNYIYNDWGNKYDGIICNPPYFKFHDYDNKNLLKEIEEKTSFRLNGFTNLYALFLLKSLHQLDLNGRAAYIIPSEFLNSDYGKLVKSYLIKDKSLRHVIVVDFEQNVFENALTTASILLFANDQQSQEVQFSYVNRIDELANIEKFVETYPEMMSAGRSVKFEDLNADIKWRMYYKNQNSVKYKNLVPFRNYGKVVRGIATGANDFFTFNTSKAKKLNIEEKYLLPCICKATDAKSSFFTSKDFEELRDNDKFVFLLNATDIENELVKKYLEQGEIEGIHQKYLTASRNPWYALEKRPPSPIWVSVFNRTGIRFIRNEIEASNLTTFHCIYLNMFSMLKTDLLFAYLLTEVSKQIFDDNRREYGNGLQKFEPNDINKANMLNIDAINEITENKILELYNLYRNSVYRKETDELFVDKINDVFIENFI